MAIALIAAMGRNRVIGLAGALPWRLPADLRHFRLLTVGKPVLMGRKTFESIGKPLPDRTNIIVTRRFGFRAEGCAVFSDLESAFDAFRAAPELMVIGGASIYGQALSRATRIYLTVIDADFEGDTYFPEYDAASWITSKQSNHRADDRNAFDFSFRVLDRRASRSG